MAESYRGLTIRIGGDTTKLTQALRTANGAISDTSTMLRNLGQALRFDPQSISAASLQVGYMANQAENTAMKLATVKTAMDQLGNKKVSFSDSGDVQSVSELARMTDEVTGNVKNWPLVASQALSSFNAINEEIAKIDNQASQLSQRMASMKSKELEGILGNLDLKSGNTDFAELDKFFDELPSHVSPGSAAVDAFKAKVLELGKAYEEATKESQKEKILKEFESLRDAMSNLSGTVFNNDKGNNGVDDIRAVFESLPDDIRPTQEAIDGIIAHLTELKSSAVDAANDLASANSVVDFQRTETQAEKLEAQVKSLSERFVELREKSSVAKAIEMDDDGLKQVNTALKAAEERFKALDAASKAMPLNIELAKSRSEALANVTDLASKKAEILRQRIEKYKSAGADKLGEDMKSVEQGAVEAAKSFEQAHAAMTKVAGELAELERQKGILSAKEGADSTSQAMTDLDAKIEATRAKWSVYAEAARRAAGAFDGAKARQELQDIQDDLFQTESKKNGKNLPIDEAAFQQAISRVGELAKQAGREIVESSNTIDAAYRDMRKTVNGTEEDFKRLHDAAVEFSQTHITSADTMLEMEALGGQLGIAASALQEFGEVSSNLDIATDIPAEEIALKLGQITNIMSDLDDTTFTNFADSLVRLGNNTATTESAIMDVAQRMASVANVTSMTTPELLAWSAAIASTGQRSESAATAINNTITGIGAAVAEGGDTLKGFAQIANMTSEDFEKAWRDNSSDALEAFVKGLEGLTEDSTTAIEALDSVGISGVRQRTALLSLSQTIDNLDKSMELSVDAFNNGGDAAREAAQKSEGFSGSLGILQNNVAALSASLGESMIPFMNALSSVLQVVTDGLNSLPGPLRTTIVEVGALTAAGGMLAATLKGLGFEVSIAGITSFISSIMSAGSAMEAFQLIGTTAFKAVGAAANALPAVAAITAVITALNELGGMISRTIEDTKLLNEATLDVSQAAAKMGDAYDAVANKSQSVDDIRDRTNAMLQDMADFGDRMEETFAKVGNDSALVDSYATVMEELSGKANLTASEMQELRNAVDQYNSITGASVTITNENTGALSLNADGIREVTDAYREQAEAQAYMELYNEAVKQQVENKEALKRATEDIENADVSWSSVLSGNIFTLDDEANKISELARAFNTAKQAVDNQEKVLEDLREHINGTASEFKNMDAALTSTGLEFEKFSGLSDEQKKRLYEIEQALKAAGDTLANYGSLTSSQLAQLVAMWNGNVGDIVAAINRMKAATEDAGSYGAPSEEQTAAFKKQLDDQYENLKATRDAEYKAAQRSFEQTRTARQHELDAEYKEAQRQSQSYLKEYKRAQQEEVDAFKDATDAKVREIDREYKAKERLLEQEESAAEKAIDAKIKALEAEQRAEDKEQESLERKHKAEEYEYKIASAKTTQKRKEAEEEYSIWKKKNQHDDAKDARKLQIDDLKEQKSDLKKQLSERKKELQDSHTEAVKDYKTEREQMLRVLQDSLDRQYEMEQQNEERRLEAIKAAHTAELDSMKYASDIALENMKARHTAELDDLKDTNALKLVEYKKHGEEVADAVKEAADAAGKSANEASDSVSTASDTVTEKMGLTLAQFSGVVTEVPGNVAQAVDVGNHTLQERLNAAVMPTTDATQKIRNAALNGLQGLPDEMGNTATSGGVSLVSHLGEYVPEAQSTADDIRKGILGPLEQAGTDAGEYGRGVTVNFGNGVAKDSSHATDNAAAVAEATGKQLGSVEGVSATWGSHAIINFANGMTSGNASSALNGALKWVADLVTAFLGHSTPDRGPLAHDDEWGGHLVDNLVTSMGAKEGELTRGVSRIADTMQEGLQGVQWEYDPAAAMVEAMREHENEVLDQAKRLSEMVERGFDPKLTMTAAYEAIDRIDAAEAKRRQPTQNVSSVTNAPVINITIPGVVVREEADVDLLSRKIADKVRREVAARLG